MRSEKKASLKETLPTSVRITPTCKQLWDELAVGMGLSKAGVLETLIREKAKTEGIETVAKDQWKNPPHAVNPLPGGQVPFYATATAEEWIRAFNQWTESHRGMNLPTLPDSALSRESIYADDEVAA